MVISFFSFEKPLHRPTIKRRSGPFSLQPFLAFIGFIFISFYFFFCLLDLEFLPMSILTCVNFDWHFS